MGLLDLEMFSSGGFFFCHLGLQLTSPEGLKWITPSISPMFHPVYMEASIMSKISWVSNYHFYKIIIDIIEKI